MAGEWAVRGACLGVCVWKGGRAGEVASGKVGSIGGVFFFSTSGQPRQTHIHTHTNTHASVCDKRVM